jgi:energy-coupling factor transporter ATP-binding protein EcfA2
LITRVELWHFKGFQRFTLYLPQRALLIGPNNAGKTTLAAALRTAGGMLARARARRAEEVVTDQGVHVPAHAFSAAAEFGLDDENLRFNLQDLETRLHVHFTGGGQLRAVWPPSGAGGRAPGFFYLRASGGVFVDRPRDVTREAFPSIAAVPVLGPFVDREVQLSEKYVRANLTSPLASAHFRNQVMLLSDRSPGPSPEGLSQWEAYRAFVRDWGPEIDLRDRRTSYSPQGVALDLFYREANRPTQMEVSWAGHGFQIWLQVLLHVFRQAETDVLVFDEPDVYLHPDLQRRLIALLGEAQGQTLVTTHSAEMVVESEPESIVWIDRARDRSFLGERASRQPGLVDALGSGLNLALARALRCRAVLFVEGHDMKILRNLARICGSRKVAGEEGVAVLGLGGFSKWTSVEPFSWLANSLLEGTVAIFVVLDSDYRDEDERKQIVTALDGVGVRGHVWQKKELENYLLVPAAIARVAGARQEWVEQVLAEICEDLKGPTTDAIAGALGRREDWKHKHEKVYAEARRRVNSVWQGLDDKLAVCGGKDVLAVLNRKLQDKGMRAVSPRALSRVLLQGEVATEVRELLKLVEAAL